MSTLISWTWDLVRRNRGKLVMTGAAIGGFVALNRYLSSWQTQWQTSSSRDFVSEVKKKEIHFENTMETCNSTSMSLSVKIIDILDTNLDPQTILNQIKQNTQTTDQTSNESKLLLWNRLKVRIFTRVICEVYCLVLFVCYLRVQLSILAGYIYVDNCGDCGLNRTEFVSNSSNVQNKYLSLLHNFYSDGIQLIIEPVLSAVEQAIKHIAINQYVSLHDFNLVFDQVKSSMAFTLSASNSNVSKLLLNSDRIFLTENTNNDNNVNNSINGKEADLLQRMLNETQDILESNDFTRVVESGIDVGFSIVMDMVLSCFVRIDRENTANSNDNSFTNPHSIRIPLAKLLPKIWLSLQERKVRDEKCILVRHLICLDVLNCFAANIYEAFCNNRSLKSI